MSKLGLVVLCTLFVLSAVGCGTMKGIGEDLKTVGGWFTKGSDKATGGM